MLFSVVSVFGRGGNSDDLDGRDASGPNSFYNVYESVFERNKRFAVILPAPSLGADDAPIDEVINISWSLRNNPRVWPSLLTSH